MASSGVKGTRWVIFYVNDLHGNLGGDPGYGGLPGLQQTIGQLRDLYSTSDIPPDGGGPRPQVSKFLTCLGGDMLRQNGSRLVHAGSVQLIWAQILSVLRPAAFVYGNHELEDWGDDGFAAIARESTEGGCSRNIEWVDPSGHVSSARCVALETYVPSCSRHTTVAAQLTFVGVTRRDREDDPSHVGQKPDACHVPKQCARFRVRGSVDTITDVLIPHCLNGDCLGAEPVLIHLAHYDETRRAEQDPDTEAGFGHAWRQAKWWGEDGKVLEPAPSNSSRPHVILKAHDHVKTRDLRGTIDLTLRCELSADRQWVPTFEAGRDGRHVGVLDLWIRDDAPGLLEYQWTTQEVQACGSWDPPARVKPQLSPVVRCGERGLQPIGGSKTDPDMVMRGLVTGLRAMLYRFRTDRTEPLLAVLPAHDVLAASEVPERRPHLERLTDAELREFLRSCGAGAPPADREALLSLAEQEWACKLDEADIESLYPGGPIGVFAVEGELLLEGLAQYVRLPFIERARLPNRPGRDAEEPGICVLWGNSVYLLAAKAPGMPGPAGEGVEVWEVRRSPGSGAEFSARAVHAIPQSPLSDLAREPITYVSCPLYGITNLPDWEGRALRRRAQLRDLLTDAGRRGNPMPSLRRLVRSYLKAWTPDVRGANGRRFWHA